MRKLLILLVVLVAVLAVGDLAARSYAETNIEQAVEERSPLIDDADASIRSFPFAGRLIVTGEVPRITLTVRDLRGGGADLIETLRLDVHGLSIDRGVLISDGRVRVTDVDRVEVTAVLDSGFLAGLAERAGVEVAIVDDGLEVSAHGQTLRADVLIEDGFVTLSAPPLPPVSIEVPPTSLVPCAIAAEVVDGQFVVTCETDELPEVVVEAIGSVELRELRE